LFGVRRGWWVVRKFKLWPLEKEAETVGSTTGKKMTKIKEMVAQTKLLFLQMKTHSCKKMREAF